MSLSLPSHSVILSPPSLDSFTIDRTEPVQGAQGKVDHFLSIPLLVALGVAAINQAIKEGKAAQTERVLRNPSVGLRGVVPDCADGYQRLLEDAMAKKQRPGSGLNTQSRWRSVHLDRVEPCKPHEAVGGLQATMPTVCRDDGRRKSGEPARPQASSHPHPGEGVGVRSCVQAVGRSAERPQARSRAGPA